MEVPVKTSAEGHVDDIRRYIRDIWDIRDIQKEHMGVEDPVDENKGILRKNTTEGEKNTSSDHNGFLVNSQRLFLSRNPTQRWDRE